MGKKGSNPNPPRGSRPPPPPPPPNRTFRVGLFGERETQKSIREREYYQIYMRGYKHGFEVGKYCEKE